MGGSKNFDLQAYADMVNLVHGHSAAEEVFTPLA